MILLYKHKSTLLFQTAVFISSVIEVWLFSGITYGWASIACVFQHEGYFQDLCSDGDTVGKNSTPNAPTASQNVSTKSVFDVGICSLQSKRFNLIFTVSLVFLCGSKFPIGLFIDKYGPRAGQTVGGCLYIIAGFGLAFVNKETADMLFPIFILFSIGGGFLAVTKYQMCRFIFTDVRSLVLSILHGTFDSSAVILLFFKLAWQSGMKLRDITLVYIFVSFIIIIISLVMLTPPYKMLLEEWSGKKDSNHTESFEDTNHDTTVSKIVILNIKAAPHSLLGSIFSPEYLLELMFLCFCQLRLWFFIGSLDELIALRFPKGDSTSVDTYNTYFGYAQLCGILVGPWIGFVFDRNTIKCRGEQDSGDKEPLVGDNYQSRIAKMEGSVLPFFLTNLLCLGFSLLSLSPWKAGLIPSFILHVLTRGFLYSAHASYIALAFRPERFATLYGLGIFVAGTFGLLEYALYSIVYNAFASDPFWINLVLLFLVLSANAFPLYLMHYCRKMKRKLKAIPIVFQSEKINYET